MFHVEHPPTSTAVNAIQADVLDTIYLGEAAQHIVRAGQAQLRVYELKPRRRPTPGAKVWLTVDPADVVILPL